MAAIETRRYEMLVRVRDFGDAHGDLFPTSSLAREQFTAVAAREWGYSPKLHAPAPVVDW